MACHYPKPAYLSRDGKVTFTRHEKALGNSAYLHIRCGMCLGCKADHARDWAIRSYHESQLHSESCFVNLTYAPEFLPPHGSLQKTDLQLFWKRLRKALNKNIGTKIRYFACGEYGTKKGRPHYHAIIFGWRPGDQRLIGKSDKGNPQYVSQIIQKAWHYGHHTWTDFDPSCARYVAHYTADKLKSFAADTPDPDTGLRPYEVIDRDGHIWQLQPEFQAQSLRPGIGFQWFQDNYREVFPTDTVVMGGKEYPPPRAYYKWLEELDPDLYERVRLKRKEKAQAEDYLSGLRHLQIATSRDIKLSRFKRPTHDKG